LKKIVALGIIVVFLCTGCGSNVTVTTEQNDLITEYVSGVLLKYSFEDEWQYTKVNKIKHGASSGTTSTTSNSTSTTASKANSTNNATTSGNITNTATTSGNTTKTATSNGSVTSSTTSSTSTSTTSDPMTMISEGLGLSGATISYTNYAVGATYPQGDLVLCVPATAGQKVVALEFDISNPTATAIVCIAASNKLAVNLLINTEAGIPESVTILKNDLINMNNVTINPGATYKAVAIFMVSDSKASNISSLSISVAINGGSAAIKKLV